MSLSYSESFIGNSWGASGGKSMQNYIADIYVSGNGTVYTDSTWDENHNATGIYQNGNLVGRLTPDDGPDSSGGQAGRSVTGDGTYIYAAFTTGAAVRRFNPNGSLATFTGGTNQGNGIPVSLANGGYVQAVVVDAANHRLFVSCDGENDIKVYDSNNLTAAPTSFSVTNPGKMAVDGSGNLWVVSQKTGTTGGKILHYTPSGTLLSDSITDSSSGTRFDPSGLAFSGGKLYVADDGPDQQVKIYSTLGGNRTAPDSTFGVKGGIYSGTGSTIGTPGPLRFRGLSGVGLDSSGNIYVGQSTLAPNVNFQQQGAHLESYKLSTGARNWELLGLEFVDGTAFDASSETSNTVDVYTKNNHYTLNLANTTPGSEWSWVGQTVNPFANPADYRATYTDYLGGQPTASYFQTLGGKKFLFCTTMNAYNFEVYRFGSQGQTATPSVTISYDHIWRDANGNGVVDTGETIDGPGAPTQNGLTGYYVDTAGDLWETYPNGNGGSSGVRQFKSQGLDSAGNPVWDFSHVTAVTEPGPMSELYRSVYNPVKSGDPLSDTQFLAGYATGIDPNHHYNGTDFNSKSIGSVISRYNSWSTGGRTAAWSIVLPDYNRAPSSMAVAGDFVFVAYDGGAYQPDDGFVYILRASDGGFVGKLQNATNNWNGRVDIEYGVSAFKRSTGEYLVTVENDFHAATTLYRWTPPSSAPAAPGVTTTAGNTYVTLNWTNDANASSYTVLRSPSANGTYTTLAARVTGTSYIDVGLTDGTTYYYKLIASGARGDITSSAVAGTPRANVALKINSGGGAVSPDWIGDAYYGGGAAGAGQVVNQNGVTNAAPAAVMGDYRRLDSAFNYTIPGLPAGAGYTARLHFDENYFRSAGQRLFNVTINSTQVLTGFDIYAADGNGTEVVRDFATTADSSGKVTITFTPTKDWALIDGVELLPAATPLPSGWSDGDIGSPGQVGSASYSGSAWTVKGGGADIWGTSDQFNYASQSVSGNQTVVAKITGISNTDPWAKAGVMLRDSTAANSMYVYAIATQGNGVRFECRTSTRGSSVGTTTRGIGAPSAANPVWLKLVKTGTTYTGSYSLNGTTWTQIGTVTASFSNANFRAGLAVTAHNNSLLNTATFTNTSVGSGAVAAYAFSEGSGTSTADSVSGSGATINGAAWTTAGHNGSALTFNGTSNSVDTNRAAIDTSGNFSVSAWVKWNGTVGHQTVVSQDGTNISGFYLKVSDPSNKMGFAVSSGDSTSASIPNVVSLASPVSGVWYFLTGVVDRSAGTLKFYVNGVLQGSNTLPSAWQATGDTIIGGGKWAGGRVDYVGGTIDDVQLCQTALSDQAVQNLAAGTPISYYKLEGDGSDAAGTSNLTLNNSPATAAGHSGNALSFNGTNQFANTTVSVLDTSRSYTVSTWVYFDGSAGWHSILTQDGSNVSSFFLQERDDTGKFAFVVTTSDVANAAVVKVDALAAPTANTWFHITGVYDASAQQIRFYVNGALQGSASFTSAWNATGSTVLGAGKWNGARVDYFTGRIDETGLYQRALSDQEVLSLYGL